MADEQAAATTEFGFVFQHTTTGIMLLDSGGKLVRFNPAAAALLELSDDARGQPISAALEGQPALLAALSASEPDGGTITLSSRREVRITRSPRKRGRQIILLEDITARGAIDAGRVALIRQVAHDLRNPINALSGFADLAATEPGASPDQVEFLERVLRIADKLYNLAGTLVDLAWIESGMPLERQPVALGDVIRAAADELADDVTRHDAALTLELPPGLPTVLGDAARLRQAIGAVLRNALLYAPHGAPVSVRAAQDGRSVRCVVQDRGFGFAPDDLPKAFDRLWRSSDPRIQAIPGGGIGLTMARAIVQRHGGRIAIESVPGSGTTVTLTLPILESW